MEPAPPAPARGRDGHTAERLLLRDSPCTETDTSRGERHPPGGGTEIVYPNAPYLGRDGRDHPPTERHHHKGENERDHPPTERHHPRGENERDHPPTERHHPRGENERDHSPAERHHPRGQNERDHSPAERHHPRGQNERDYPRGDNERDYLLNGRNHPKGNNERENPAVQRHHLRGEDERDHPPTERHLPIGKNDRDHSPAERHHPRGENERDHPPTERHHPRGENERDLPTSERHHPRGENDREHPLTERHHPKGEEQHHTSAERQHPTGENERDHLSAERHHPRGDNKRVHPSAETQNGRGNSWAQSMDWDYTQERDSLSSETGHPGRAGYWGDRQPAGSYDRLSVERAHTMKDFEKQITELKKENFNLKLRIYFLEEQIQRRCDNSSEELHRMNIELKVEVESLKHDFQEKQKLLVRASKAVESLAGEHGSSVQRLREEHHRQLQDIEQPLLNNIHLMEEELAHKKVELEKVCAVLDQERLQRFTAEERLLALKEQYAKSMGVLEERDWIIQCLNENLRSKDSFIAQLEKKVTTMTPRETPSGKISKSVGTLFPDSSAREDDMGNVELVPERSKDDEEKVKEWQEKISERDNLINDLQQKLEANTVLSAIEEKNALKRDKAIQGLTLALKTKNKENQKLLKEMDHLHAALAKARESSQLQSVKENIDPEYKKLIFTLQSEQEMYSRLLAYERESNSLQKERDAITMLRRWLEDNIQANQELRKMMEAQIMARTRDSDTISFLGDQTSYLSICLEHLDPNYYFLAGEQHWKKSQKHNSSNVENGEDFSLVLVEDGTPSKGLALPQEHQVQSSTSKDQVDCPLRLSSSESDPVKDDPDTTLTQATNDEHAVSSSSQTEPVYYADKSTMVEICNLAKDFENFQGGKDNDIDSVCQQLALKASKSHSETQRGQKQSTSLGAKKSRLPVLSKYSSHTKFQTYTAKPTSTEENHESLAEELQIEKSRLCDTLNCAEMEIESLKANEALEKQTDNTCDQEHEEKAERESSEQTLHQELQSENSKLSKQITGAETKKLQENEALGKHANNLSDIKDVDKTERGSSEQTLQQEIQNEHKRKANEALEKHAYNPSGFKNVDKAERDSSEKTLQQELEMENIRLSEQLQHAQKEIDRLRSGMNEDSSVLSSQKELQIENIRLLEQLQQAQKEVRRFRVTEALEKRMDMYSPDLMERGSLEETLQQELQMENFRLLEQLQQAQKEIERLRANEALAKYVDMHGLDRIERDPSEKTLQQELQMENNNLLEQLQHAQREFERLRSGGGMKPLDTPSDSENTNKPERDSSVLSSQKELQIENNSLLEQLQQAQKKIERLRVNEALEKRMDIMCGPDSMERDSSVETIQKELQIENNHLSEQLQQAQWEIERLRSGGGMKPGDNQFDSENTNKPERDSSVLSLQKELQIETIRLSEQFKSSQTEIKKLSADINYKTPDNSSADYTDYPELSFLDKTITNFTNAKEIHDDKSDLVLDVCKPITDSQNVSGIHCQHYNYCAECAKNRDVLLRQTSVSKRMSGVREHSCNFPKGSNSGRSFEDTTSLSKYDLLVQSQARELSLQRKRIKESHNISIICSKHFFNILKAFKDLLPTSDLDSNIALGFQEQLNQTIEWLKELEYKLSDAFYGEEDAYSDHSLDSLLYTPSRLVPGHRMWADKRGCHVLGLVEDYNALRKQILEAKSVLQETEAFVDHGAQAALLNMTEHFGNIFFEKLSRTKQSLEEANCLLKLLWRVSLPTHDPYSIHQEEEASREITRLRRRVVEQEKLLSGMMKRVYSENQMKEDIEKLILDQLAVTHDILKRAKGNLEVQVVDKRH